MSSERERLIASLTRDLEPRPRAGRTGGLFAAWLVAATLASIVGLLAGGPMRPGSLVQLASSPRFLLESAVGVLAIVALGFAGLRLAVPALRPPLATAVAPLGLLAAWIAFYLYGLESPALEPSMAGKRAHCLYETALLGLPGLGLGIVFARRLWPLHGAWSGTLLGLAAGALPALGMQFACMYVPQHILLHHVLPGLAVGAIGALAGHVLLRPR